MDSNNKNFLNFISEELEVQTIVKSVEDFNKLASYSDYDFSSLEPGLKIKDVMTLYYIEVLIDKKIITKECGNNLEILYRELIRLNKIYGKLLLKELISEGKENKEETEDIAKLIAEIERLLQEYGILNEEGLLDIKLSIPSVIEASIDEKYQTKSLDNANVENYEEIMKKVRTIN